MRTSFCQLCVHRPQRISALDTARVGRYSLLAVVLEHALAFNAYEALKANVFVISGKLILFRSTRQDKFFHINVSEWH